MPTSLFARRGPALYCGWAALAIVVSLGLGGFSRENLTRLMVLALLTAELIWRRPLQRKLAFLPPRERFIALGLLLAALVEGFHMISRPVFLALRIDPDTGLAQALLHYLIDLAFTLPAYLLIFSLIWYFARRYLYTPWQYLLIMGLGQVLGDGGIFYFLAAPGMLLFLPYPMSNYHAINLLPYLTVREHLAPSRRGGWLAIPALISLYLTCGAAIRLIGKPLGFE